MHVISRSVEPEQEILTGVGARPGKEISDSNFIDSFNRFSTTQVFFYTNVWLINFIQIKCVKKKEI